MESDREREREEDVSLSCMHEMHSCQNVYHIPPLSLFFSLLLFLSLSLPAGENNENTSSERENDIRESRCWKAHADSCLDIATYGKKEERVGENLD